MSKQKMKTYTLAEMKDKYIGKVGTKDRDDYEYELNMEVLRHTTKKANKKENRG